MSKIYVKPIFVTLFLCAAFSTSHAQIFDRIKKKAEKAAEKVVEDALNNEDDPGSSAQEAETSGNRPARAVVNPVFDFTPGDSLMLADDLSGETAGSMPHLWKSSGAGQVVTFPGVSGNWLLLNEFTTYKLDTLLIMPANFTLEFDILTRSDQARDLHAFKFGFARDNSVRSYISDAHNDNAITQTTIHYWNEEVVNSSSDTDIYNSRDFELAGYSNAAMHIAIQVHGETMKVFLDKKKVLDTRMFDPGVRKYFYLSTATNIDNNGQLAVSNLRIKE